jgi:hypothetical protein
MFILSAFLSCYSQNFSFTYDNAGNRINRNVVGLKSTVEANADENQDTTYSESIGDIIITIYPNPVNEQLLVEIKGRTGEQKDLVYLFDMKGNLITTIETTDELTPVSFKELPRGTYILQIHTGANTSEWKIIRE